MIVRLTSLSWVMDVWRRFSICLSLEKDYSALHLVTIKTKYILSAIAILGKMPCTPLSIISLYKNSSVLMFPGSLSLNISANLAEWHCSSTKWIVEIIWVRINESWQLSVALLGIILTGNQSSQTDQPVAYKLVGVGLAKQWTGGWKWRAEPMRVSHVHA